MRFSWKKQTGIPDEKRASQHEAIAECCMPCVFENHWSDSMEEEDCHDDADGIGQDDDRQQEQIVEDAPYKGLRLQVNDEIADQQQRFQLLDATAGICDDNLRRARQGDSGQMIFDVDL